MDVFTRVMGASVVVPPIRSAPACPSMAANKMIVTDVCPALAHPRTTRRLDRTVRARRLLAFVRGSRASSSVLTRGALRAHCSRGWARGSRGRRVREHGHAGARVDLRGGL